MQSTLLPSSCYNAIEELIRKFIWGYTDTKPGISLVKWSDLCQPLSNKRCGLIKLEPQKKAQSKIAKKIVAKPNLLWVRLLRGKYQIRDTLPLDIGKHSSSHFWRNLAAIWSNTMMQIKWTPANGRNIRFWSDYWVGDLWPLWHLSFADIPNQTMWILMGNGDGICSNIFRGLSLTKSKESQLKPTLLCAWLASGISTEMANLVLNQPTK